MATRIWTVGHSTRTTAQLLEILAAASIARLVDVRTVPKSRYNPQFNRDALAWELEQAGLEYRHAPGLGGLRKPVPDSINGGLHQEGLRGYADHMQTDKFERAVERLIGEAGGAATAVMCAEAAPTGCHRNLLSDALEARGLEVHHLLEAGVVERHRLSPLARVRETNVSYPGLL